MNRTLTLTYDKSNEDVPVLCVADNNFYSISVLKIFTGKRAEQLYEELTGQNTVVKLASEEEA